MTLTRLTRAELDSRNPAFGMVGANIEWRRCGTPSDEFGRGLVLRFADGDDWYAVDGTLVERSPGRWTWADGSEIVQP